MEDWVWGGSEERQSVEAWDSVHVLRVSVLRVGECVI